MTERINKLVEAAISINPAFQKENPTRAELRAESINVCFSVLRVLHGPEAKPEDHEEDMLAIIKVVAQIAESVAPPVEQEPTRADFLAFSPTGPKRYNIN